MSHLESAEEALAKAKVAETDEERQQWLRLATVRADLAELERVAPPERHTRPWQPGNAR